MAARTAPTPLSAPARPACGMNMTAPEDLYEDNPGDYEDEDEAWDAWEND